MIIEKTFRACDEELENAIGFVSGILEDAGCGIASVMAISVAVEEIFVNIAHYAYENGGDAHIKVETDDGKITITFADSGVPFNPLNKPDPDVTLSAEERQIGGLGIYLVKETMDEVKYEYIDGQNVLTLIRNGIA